MIHPDPNAVNQLHVGRPNIGDKQVLMRRFEEMLNRRWFSNSGPFVQEFESALSELLDVKHVMAMCNATVALEIAARALDLSGEVIMPSYTFIATAHSMQWQGITPVFCDIEPETHHLDPGKIEALITPKTSAVVGVHTWGRSCDTAAIEAVASKHNLKVLYDAAHAFGCSNKGRMIGSSGQCEVFSFHATKFINCFEGGAVVTNNDALAEKIRLMRNFGFKGFDNVVYLGINGKMPEASAAMGLTSLEAMEDIIAVNRRNYMAYERCISDLPGISLLKYSESERNNYQYIIIEVDPEICPRTRDQIIEALNAENVIARRYFWPGCHRMEPYRSLQPNAYLLLEETEKVSARVIVLPTGQAVDVKTVEWVCGIIRRAVAA
ncbi:MAG: dTDP-4-dehydro-6-deoxyglucose aminotransferase [Verrucomicrobia bacterium]|nr:dTDP-4-dehydro-6-deoxyglucose aminotransferase [Verrucomicrobiota bacterium]